MTYRYKRTQEGKIAKRKAHCSIRGDRMKAGQHFDPKKPPHSWPKRPQSAPYSQ